MSTNVGNTTFTPNTSFNVNLGINGRNIVGLIIANKSGYEFTVTPENCDAKILYPGFVDFFATRYAWSGVVFFAPTGQTLPNVQNYPARLISFETVYKGEDFNPSAYPMSLAAIQAVSPTASGKALFSASIGFGSAVTTLQKLNIFNPANSGVVMTFHSARFFTSDATKGNLGFLTFKSGADLNLVGGTVAIVNHDSSATAKVSVAHATFEDATTAYGGTDIEGLDTQANVTMEFLQFPDTYTLRPGGNIRITMAQPTASGAAVRETFKWGEDQYV